MRYFTAFLLFAISLFAQSPDVAQYLTFTAATAGAPVFVGAGGPNGAVAWRLTYYVDGTAITAAQVAIQGADAPTAAGCSVGGLVWTTITTAGSSLVEVVNPSVSAAQGNIAVKSFYPCIRANVTAITGAAGTVKTALYGYKTVWVFPTPAIVIPSGTQDVNLIQIDGTAVPSAGVLGALPVGGTVATNGLLSAETFPQLVAGEDYGGTPHIQVPKVDSSGRAVVQGDAAIGSAPSGNPIPEGLRDSAGNIIVPDYCTLKAVIASPAIGLNLLIAHSGTTTIRICKWSFTTDNLTTAQLITGTTTKTPCDGATVNETHVYTGAGGGVFGIIEDYQNPLITTAGKDLCIGLGAGVTAAGGITIEYSQR